MESDDYTRTRRSLHGVAELLMAGPQFRAHGTIKLRPAPGGFSTIHPPLVAVDGDLLLVNGSVAGKLSGTTFAELAAHAGIDAGAPADLYSDSSGCTLTDTIHVDLHHAQTIARAFDRGDRALRRLNPAETPVLWPEHFDLGITADRINFGVSPGDAHIPEPYAYVGPWDQRTGPFWNESFGAAHTLTDLSDADALFDFFTEGYHRATES
ncbi:hypothetical protein ACIRRA_32045 [Nocardia sp. NPDC101769]|uniref:hypothetical protein n=1 Tax=Nocardia sp. NPDC101769 TaxID=3364333 RepID=UPI003815CAD2